MAHPDNTRDQRAFVIGGLLILLVGGYFIGKNFFFNNERTDDSSTPPALVDKKEGVPLMEPAVLLKKMQNGDALMLVDIRDETSFQEAHIAHAVSVPISGLGSVAPAQDETLVIIFSDNDPQAFETAKNIMSQKSFPYFFSQRRISRVEGFERAAGFSGRSELFRGSVQSDVYKTGRIPTGGRTE